MTTDENSAPLWQLLILNVLNGEAAFTAPSDFYFAQFRFRPRRSSCHLIHLWKAPFSGGTFIFHASTKQNQPNKPCTWTRE